MAIQTLDGALAGMQPLRSIAKAVTATLVAGRPASLWSLGGSPGAGSFDATLNGVALSSSSAMVSGQIPHVDPGTGNSYLARFTGTANQPGTLLLCDRLWHNGGYTITSTAAQNTTFPGLPARSADGTSNGDGVYAAVEVSAATGAGTPTLTVGYTNQAGTAGRTATNVLATSATSAVGAFYQIGLQAGDTGIRSVQSLTLSATWTSGTINLVLYRILAALPITQANVHNEIDVLTGAMQRLYNGVVPFLVFVPNTTTAANISGTYAETQG